MFDVVDIRSGADRERLGAYAAAGAAAGPRPGFWRPVDLAR